MKGTPGQVAFVHVVARWVKLNPTRAAAIATAALAVAAALGTPDGILAAVAGLLAVVIGGPVYNAVSPLPHVVATVRSATTDAAAQVASRLDPETAGKVGTITDTAVDIATTAADAASDAALRQLGVKRKDRE